MATDQLARLRAIKERIDKQKGGGTAIKRSSTTASTETCDFLCFDVSAMMHRSFHAQQPSKKAKTVEDVKTLANLTIHNTIVTMAKYFRKYHPTKRVILAFDRHSWRKDYTASEACVSKVPYKGNRADNLKTEWDKVVLGIFRKAMDDFEKLMDTRTSCVCLRQDSLEADDLLAACSQYLAPKHKVVIITTDSDIAQERRRENVQVITPATDKPHDLSKFNDDPEYYLFQKIVRGDSTDNIASAFPRVRATKIHAAYTDEFAKQNFMAETWKNHEDVEFSVRELFEENRLLIDLSAQPDNIRELMKQTLREQLDCPAVKYDMFAFCHYLGKNELTVIADRINDYIPVLSLTTKEPLDINV